MAETIDGTSSADIQAVDRCGQILRMFSTDTTSVRVADVAAELGVGRTTAHRYLSSLAAAGLLQRHDPGYALGPLLVHVGALALDGLGVVDVADPYLRELADTAGETSVLGVWGGRGPVVVRSHQPRERTLNISIRVGRSLNVDAAQSAVYLAHRPDSDTVTEEMAQPQARRVRARVEQVRTLGIAISDTVNQGARAVAAPVYDRSGALVATVAIIGTLHTLPADPESGQIQALRATARELSAALGHHGPDRI